MARLETSLRHASFFLRVTSSWPLRSDASALRKFANLTHFVVVTNGLALLFVQILFYVVLEVSEPEEMMGVISTQVIFLHSGAKIVILRLRSRTFKKLVNSVQYSITHGSDKFLKYLNEYNRPASALYKAYITVVLTLSLGYITKPIWTASEFLPLHSWYPFDYKNSTAIYSLIYAQQIICILLCWSSATIDVFFGIFIMKACSEFKVLQQKLRRLTENRNGKNFTGEVDERLAECVNLHNKSLGNVENINDIYTYIALLLFFTTILTICCGGFQMLNAFNESVKSRMVICLLVISVVAQLLLYYVPGNVLIEEALGVQSAAYECGWEVLSARHRRSVLFIMMRSSILPQLQIGRTTYLTLENYSKFLTTTASYFTSLQSIVGKK